MVNILKRRQPGNPEIKVSTISTEEDPYLLDTRITQSLGRAMGCKPGDLIIDLDEVDTPMVSDENIAHGWDKLRRSAAAARNSDLPQRNFDERQIKWRIALLQYEPLPEHLI